MRPVRMLEMGKLEKAVKTHMRRIMCQRKTTMLQYTLKIGAAGIDKSLDLEEK